MSSFRPDSGSVSSILKGIVSGPESMLEKLVEAGEFRQATQLMTTVITVLNQDSSHVTRPDSSDFENRVEVGARACFDTLKQGDIALKRDLVLTFETVDKKNRGK